MRDGAVRVGRRRGADERAERAVVAAPREDLDLHAGRVGVRPRRPSRNPSASRSAACPGVAACRGTRGRRRAGRRAPVVVQARRCPRELGLRVLGPGAARRDGRVVDARGGRAWPGTRRPGSARSCGAERVGRPPTEQVACTLRRLGLDGVRCRRRQRAPRSARRKKRMRAGSWPQYDTGNGGARLIQDARGTRERTRPGARLRRRGHRAAPLPLERDHERYERFVEQGFHGEMGYLAGTRTCGGASTRGHPRGREERRLPRERLPAHGGRGGGGPAFRQGASRATRAGTTTTMARARSCAKLARFRSHARRRGAARCRDDVPVLERAWAARAGLGFVGKNGMLIIPGRGSFVLLGEVVTTLELERRPADARAVRELHPLPRRVPDPGLRRPFVLDARSCVAYLTIELRAPIPDDAPRGRRRAPLRLRRLPDRVPLQPLVAAARRGEDAALPPSRALGRDRAGDRSSPPSCASRALRELSRKGTPLHRATRRRSGAERRDRAGKSPGRSGLARAPGGRRRPPVRDGSRGRRAGRFVASKGEGGPSDVVGSGDDVHAECTYPVARRWRPVRLRAGARGLLRRRAGVRARRRARGHEGHACEPRCLARARSRASARRARRGPTELRRGARRSWPPRRRRRREAAVGDRAHVRRSARLLQAMVACRRRRRADRRRRRRSRVRRRGAPALAPRDGGPHRDRAGARRWQQVLRGEGRRGRARSRCSGKTRTPNAPSGRDRAERDDGADAAPRRSGASSRQWQDRRGTRRAASRAVELDPDGARGARTSSVARCPSVPRRSAALDHADARASDLPEAWVQAGRASSSRSARTPRPKTAAAGLRGTPQDASAHVARGSRRPRRGEERTTRSPSRGPRSASSRTRPPRSSSMADAYAKPRATSISRSSSTRLPTAFDRTEPRRARPRRRRVQQGGAQHERPRVRRRGDASEFPDWGPAWVAFGDALAGRQGAGARESCLREGAPGQGARGPGRGPREDRHHQVTAGASFG